jgi:hypothetical protein
MGLGGGAARERVRVARALGKLHLVDEALRTGELSFSKVRALSRIASPDTEASLLEVARTMTGAQLERFCRALRKSAAPTRGWEERFVRKRTISDTGLVRIELQLRAEEAETVWAALLAGAREAVGADEATKSTTALVEALLRFAKQLLDTRAFSPDGEPDPSGAANPPLEGGRPSSVPPNVAKRAKGRDVTPQATWCTTTVACCVPPSSASHEEEDDDEPKPEPEGPPSTRV